MKTRVLLAITALIGLIISAIPAGAEEPGLVLFLGDSLTAGYGLDQEAAFPALIEKKIKKSGRNFEVFNAGLSGETSSGGLRRIDWVLRRKTDVMVLELGANDGLRGIPLGVTRHNLQRIIDRAKKRFPEMRIVVAGMMVPPNLGPHYSTEFQSIFPELARNNGAVLIPFLLEGVAGDPSLNLPDGIHPTAEGHAIVAQNVWKYLEPVLESLD